jgi:hypothetical protein
MSSLPCLVCGTTPSHLHHALPKSVWPQHRDNPDVLVPLCYPCHNDWHDGRARVCWEDLPPVTRALIQGSAGQEWIDRWYPSRPLADLPY